MVVAYQNVQLPVRVCLDVLCVCMLYAGKMQLVWSVLPAQSILRCLYDLVSR